MDIVIRNSGDGATIPHDYDPVAALKRLAERGEEVALSVCFEYSAICDESRRIQKELIACSTTGVVKSLHVKYHYGDEPRKNLDFFLRYLKRSRNKTRDYHYELHNFLTIRDARKIAIAIQTARKNGCAIDRFSITNDFDMGKSFKHVFNAALDNGVREFSADFGDSRLSFDAASGCLAGSNLAANTTLKKLHLHTERVSHGHLPVTTFAEQFSEAIRSNVGLEEFNVEKSLMTGSEGRKILLKALRDNGTLLRLGFHGSCPYTRHPPSWTSANLTIGERQLELGRIQVVQREIDAQLEANRTWKRYATNYAKPLPTTNSSDVDKRSIALGMYPAVLQALANKPMHLFRFVKREIPQLLAVVSRPGPSPVLLRRSKRIAASSLKEDVIISKKRRT